MKSSAGAISIAQATGGRDSRLNDPVAEVRRVLEESQAYYLIGYEPVDGRPGERRVQVRVVRDGLKVLARKRYVVIKPKALKTRVAPEVAMLHSISDATDLPMRADVLAPVGELGSSSVAISFEIPASSAPGRRRLALVLEARPRDGGDPVLEQADVTLEQADRPARFERRLALSPGVWQARTVLRDLATGRLGSVLLTFEVPVR